MTSSDFSKSRSRRSLHPAQPLARRHMPVDMGISLANYTIGRTTRIPADRGPSQPLAGFDPDYRNIVDYIVRITHRIWETDARVVDYIAECYAPDSRVFDDYGLQRGNKKIIADTRHTTAAFPDIVLDAAEVVWAGDDRIGFHTSHAVRIVGTNTGPSRYGPATGARIDVPVIANCVARENDIFLEHVLYNTSAMLQQLGKDIWAEAARLAADPPPGWPRNAQVWAELRAGAAPSPPLRDAEPVAGFDPDAFARDAHASIWNGDMGALATAYAADVSFEGATNRRFDGIQGYRGYVTDIRTAFPDLALQVDEVYWMGSDADGWLIATRWSAEGTHEGAGLYRDPTGQGCQLWGITQWRVVDARIVQEFQLFNEFDLMMQIEKARM